jgi:PKD repeat protein
MKMKHIMFLMVSALSISVRAQVKTSTYAGVQYVDSGRFNGTATNPILSELYSRPQAVYCDTNNRMYVTDEHNVMLIDGATSRNRGGFRGDPTSTLSLGSSNGTGLVSRFSTPTGVAVHPKSNDVYVCDRNNNLIRKGSKFVNSSNETSWSTLTGKDNFTGGYVNGLVGVAEFNTPEDLEISDAGIFYICDNANNCIRQISNGSVTTLAGNGNFDAGYKDGNDTFARFDRPTGICLENSNSLLVADRNNGMIRRINLTTKAVTTLVKDLNFPLDVCVVGSKVVIAEATCLKIYDGNTTTVFAGNETKGGYLDDEVSKALFRNISHIYYRKADKSVYVVDNGNNVIRKVPLTDNAVADFVANVTSPIVNQTIKLTSNSFNNTSQTWTITPNSYTLQAGSLLTDKIVYVSFNNVGTFSVSLNAKNISSNDVLTKTNYISVSTNSVGLPAVDFTASSVTPGLNQLVTLIDMTSNNATSYKWTITPADFKFSGTSTQTDRNPTVKFEKLGYYTIKLDATNGNGNGTLTKTNFINVVVNGTKQVIGQNISIYPNPAQNTLVVNGLNENQSIRFTDVTGKSTMLMVRENNQIDISHLARGIYFLTIDNHGEIFKLGKFILEN